MNVPKRWAVAAKSIIVKGYVIDKKFIILTDHWKCLQNIKKTLSSGKSPVVQSSSVNTDTYYDPLSVCTNKV